MSAETAVTKEFSQYEFSIPVETPKNTNIQVLDEVLTRIYRAASSFAALSLDERIQLVKSMQEGYINVAERLVSTACRAKGIDPESPLASEEWAVVHSVIRQLRLIRESLQSLRDSGNTPIGRIGRTIDHRLTVQTFPMSQIDGLLFKDVTSAVHLQSGITEKDLDKNRAGFYKNPGHRGRVVLVLGAGNITAIPSMDVLTKMFNEGKTCVLKMNPVNAYAGPLIEEAFEDAVKKNYLAIVYGGVEESKYLINSEMIDEIHITGSDKTHDAIVWGATGTDRAERMARNKPLINKEITSELGNVTPVIVVPGPYKERELAFQAEDIAGAFTFNASFLCCCPVVMLTAKSWQQRKIFLEHLESILSKLPARKAYYPGAVERWQLFMDKGKHISKCGEVKNGETPWTLIKGLDPNSDEPIYLNEPFCSVLTESVFNAMDTIEFLEQAVNFANRKLWGTLTANLIVHPQSMKDPGIADAVERAITRLNYGVVTVNGFNGMAFSFSTPPWGAHPGSSLTDIQSGRGWVHNTSMLEGVEKTVLRFPLTAFPKPVWHPSHKTGLKLMPRLIELERDGSWSKVPGVVWTAMRG